MLLQKYLDRYVGIPLCYGLAAVDSFWHLFHHDDDAVPVRRILLIKLWGVGNVVMILPLVEAVRRRFPDAELHFLTLRANADLLAGRDDLAAVHTLPERPWFRSLGALLAIWLRLRKRFDVVLDFEQFARTSTILSYALGIPQRVGLDTPGQGRGLLYNARIPYRNDRHMVETFADVVRAVGVRIENPAPSLSADSAGRGEADALVAELGERRPRVLIHLGSGDNFPGRRWPGSRFAELADRLAMERGAQIVFTGTERERALIASCRDQMSSPSFDAVGRLSLRGLVGLLEQTDLLVSNDTGPVHLASGVRCPVVALYGPNTPVLYGPRGGPHRTIYENLPCSPCLTNFNSKTSTCRLPECMRSIETPQVFAACTDLLDEQEGRGRRLRVLP
ncbi:MAG: glycosyltransferase family 9 protein [Planctomycetota bacterium]